MQNIGELVMLGNVYRYRQHYSLMQMFSILRMAPERDHAITIDTNF